MLLGLGWGNLTEELTSKQCLGGGSELGRQARVRACALGRITCKDKGLEMEKKWLISLKILVPSYKANAS